MNKVAMLPIAAAALVMGACEQRGTDDPSLAPGMEQTQPQTTAPGDPMPPAEPIPRTAPGVIQEDTLHHPGQPGPDAAPGI
jgi:hypothetical protein